MTLIAEHDNMIVNNDSKGNYYPNLNSKNYSIMPNPSSNSKITFIPSSIIRTQKMLVVIASIN